MDNQCFEDDDHYVHYVDYLSQGRIMAKSHVATAAPVPEGGVMVKGKKEYDVRMK